MDVLHSPCPAATPQEMMGACKLLEQIEQRKQDELIELERRAQESAAEYEQIVQECMREIASREERRGQQDKLRAELNEANEDMRRRRMVEKERDKLLDLKVLQIQKEKAVSIVGIFALPPTQPSHTIPSVWR